MIMGNASGRKDGEGTSGVKKNEYEESYERHMETAPGRAHVSYHAHRAYPEPMVHSPPHSTRAYQPPLMSTAQVPTAPLPPGEIMQVRNQTAAMIVWSYGGKQVAITGSWDNWGTIEPLHNLGKDFIITKMLPSGIYQYRFIVDERLTYAPDLPWESDDSGSAYNILDLQVPMAPLPRPGETVLLRNHEPMQDSTYCKDVLAEKWTAATITWSYGGKQVAVTGSWDNWGTREPLHGLGKDFIIIKRLPSGVYHYRFIVDEQLRYAPDLPWESDDSGSAYNILDLQEYVPEAPESLSEFESPPSPLSSYDNQSLRDGDFSKLPPDLPPQLQMMLLHESSSAMASDQSLPRPQHEVLNHLFIQNTDNGQPVALSSTHRFCQKYVTVVLYKPSQR